MRIELGKPTHCVETSSGRNTSGILQLSAKTIRVDFYDYFSDFHIDGSKPLYLFVETGEVVSLHRNIESVSGSIGRLDGSGYHQGLIANVAIVGDDRWNDTDKIKRVSFTVKHSDDLLFNIDMIKSLHRTKIFKRDNDEIFVAQADSMTLRAYFGATYGMYFDAPKDFWSVFEIEFLTPKSLDEYIDYVLYYVDFISLGAGVRLFPHKIRIDRLSRSEIASALETRTYFGPHTVHYIWPEQNLDSRDVWAGGSPFIARDVNEIGALISCLVAWMNRANSWRESYVMMRDSFSLRGVISAERLINACRWLEDIPISSSQGVLPKEHIDQIAAFTSSKAKELGYAPAIQERIASAMSWIRAESSGERFTRLVSTIRDKFGENILPESVISDLRAAIRFRGKTAHGHFEPHDQTVLHSFYKSILAMEAFCYLLMTLDLDVSVAGVQRIRSNPVLEAYFFAGD